MSQPQYPNGTPQGPGRPAAPAPYAGGYSPQQGAPSGQAPYPGAGPAMPPPDPRGRQASGHEVAPWRPGELSAPQQGATGLAMKRRHPVAVWLGLPLITFGIYGLVWYYKIHREMAEFDRRRQVPVAGPLLVILFLGWTVVAPLVSFYNTGNRIADAQRSAGLPVTCSPVVGLLLCFVFGLQTLYYQAELNRVVDAYRAPAHTPVVLAS